MASDKYETTGIVHLIPPPVTRGKYTSRTLVLATEPGKYEQFPAFEFGEKAMPALDDLRVGDTVKVEWNLRGRRWDDPKGGTKWFVTLSGWKATLVPGEPRGVAGIGPDGDGDIPF